MKEWFVYIVKCIDDSYYTGITKDLKKRILDHNTGRGAKYTRSRAPVECVFYLGDLSQSEALKMENKIKKLSRQKKIDLSILFRGFYEAASELIGQ